MLALLRYPECGGELISSAVHCRKCIAVLAVCPNFSSSSVQPSCYQRRSIPDSIPQILLWLWWLSIVIKARSCIRTRCRPWFARLESARKGLYTCTFASVQLGLSLCSAAHLCGSHSTPSIPSLWVPDCILSGSHVASAAGPQHFYYCPRFKRYWGRELQPAPLGLSIWRFGSTEFSRWRLWKVPPRPWG